MTQSAPRSDTPASSSIDEHRERILTSVARLSTLSLSITESLGHTLASSVLALVDVPGFDNSAMDGYAVRRQDVATAGPETPVALRVVADLAAGAAENPRLGAGEAARIMTGAPVPTEADCIVPVEDTDGGTSTVLIRRCPEAAAFIRSAGSDVLSGNLVLSAGRSLGARDLAAAAATGSSSLRVSAAPRVGVLSTGSELRAPGEPLERGQIHDSNSTLLAAAIVECGGVPVLLGSVPDVEAAFRAILDAAAPTVDAIVTSGGVSVGAYDIVKAVLAPLGVWFGPVRMQPGKPQGFGVLPSSDGTAGTPVFALPGNPVSVFVSFEQFVRPALLAMQGRTMLERDPRRGTVVEAWRSPAGRTQFMPVRAEHAPSGALEVRPASSGGAGSYLVASLAGANALAVVPESTTSVNIGDELELTFVP